MSHRRGCADSLGRWLEERHAVVRWVATWALVRDEAGRGGTRREEVVVKEMQFLYSSLGHAKERIETGFDSSSSRDTAIDAVEHSCGSSQPNRVHVERARSSDASCAPCTLPLSRLEMIATICLYFSYVFASASLPTVRVHGALRAWR